MADAKTRDEKKTAAGKRKVIRDSFTLPLGDYQRIAELKKKCLDLGIDVKKSELVRAGLTILDQLPPGDLERAVAAVERIKTGRPVKEKT